MYVGAIGSVGRPSGLDVKETPVAPRMDSSVRRIGEVEALSCIHSVDVRVVVQAPTGVLRVVEEVGIPRSPLPGIASVPEVSRGLVDAGIRAVGEDCVILGSRTAGTRLQDAGRLGRTTVGTLRGGQANGTGTAGTSQIVLSRLDLCHSHRPRLDRQEPVYVVP